MDERAKAYYSRGTEAWTRTRERWVGRVRPSQWVVDSNCIFGWQHHNSCGYLVLPPSTRKAIITLKFMSLCPVFFVALSPVNMTGLILCMEEWSKDSFRRQLRSLMRFWQKLCLSNEAFLQSTSLTASEVRKKKVIF